MDQLLNKLAIVVSIGLQLVIFSVLIRKRLYRRFPWFLIYIAYAVVEAVLRLIAAGSQHLYYNVYWLTTIGDVSCTVLAVRESFLNVFRAYTNLRWFILAVWSCIGLAVLYAVYKAWFFPPTPATRRGAIVVGLQLGLDYTMVIIGLLYFGLRRFFRIRDRQWESGIISGFTIYAAFEIMALVARSAFGTRFRTAREWVPAIAYIIAEIGWVVVLIRPERRVPPPRDLKIDDLAELDQYSGFLARFLGRKS